MSSRFSSLKRHCCFTTVQLASKHLRRAKELISTGRHEDVESALAPLDVALELYPNWEKALELKARVLLYLKRFTDVVELLHEFLPGEKPASEQANSPTETRLLVEQKAMSLPEQARGRLLFSRLRRSPAPSKQARGRISLPSLRYKFSNSGVYKSGPAVRLGWRYLILGQACCHLGMMEDAMVLLQNGKKTASAASRFHSNGMRDDNFCSENGVDTTHTAEFDLVNHMLANIKLLLRRRAAAEAALEAGLYAESVRHFTKIIENQKNTPPGFIADCFLHRAIAYQATGRVVDAIADCNWNLTLIPRCAKALSVRASLHEMVNSFSECLLDLQQLKMIYEASLRQQALADWAAPEWTVGRRSSPDMNISGGLDYINSKITATRRRLCSRTCPLAARTILDLPQHCSMEDVEKAYLLLSLKHSPDKATLFVQNCVRQDGGRDMEAVKEEARASALRLSHLIHKAYTKLLSVISEEEAEEQYEHRARESALRRRCANRKSLLQSRVRAERREEDEIKSSHYAESSDERGLADNEGSVTEFEEVSDDEGHRVSHISNGVSTEEDLTDLGSCRASLCNEDKSNDSVTEAGKMTQDLKRKCVNVDGKRGLERPMTVAYPEKRCTDNGKPECRNALHIAHDAATTKKHMEAEVYINGEGDSNKVIMVNVMEALIASIKQSGNVDMESRAEKMIRAAMNAEPDRRADGELHQLMMNNQGLLCSSGALGNAMSQALSIDSPNQLLAHQHWLMNIQDSLAWSLPISQPLSVT